MEFRNYEERFVRQYDRWRKKAPTVTELWKLTLPQNLIITGMWWAGALLGLLLLPVTSLLFFGIWLGIMINEHRQYLYTVSRWSVSSKYTDWKKIDDKLKELSTSPASQSSST